MAGQLHTLPTFVTHIITGKRAYEKGLYQDSVRLFEKALNEEGWMSRLGGDIQLWLALAYQVHLQRHEPCHMRLMQDVSWQ